MIDTDKYEGHTPGPWCVDECDGYNTHEDNPAGYHIYALRLREDVAPYPISDGLPLATNVYYYRSASNKKGFLDSEMSKVVQEEALKLRETTSEYANSLLMADAPLLLQALIDERAEVKRLRQQLLQGVMYMHMTCRQTKDGRIHNAEKFERQVREMIE